MTLDANYTAPSHHIAQASIDAAKQGLYTAFGAGTFTSTVEVLHHCDMESEDYDYHSPWADADQGYQGDPSGRYLLIITCGDKRYITQGRSESLSEAPGELCRYRPGDGWVR